MDAEQIRQEIHASDHRFVKFGVIDIDGVLRGKIISREKFLKGSDQLGFCDVVFGWDVADAPYNNTSATGWHTGYPDATASVDMATFRRIPWQGGMPFFLADYRNDERIGPLSPRNLLLNLADKCQKAGFEPLVSKEYEWFNFAETPHCLSEKKYSKLRPLSPGKFGYSLLRLGQNQSYVQALYKGLSDFNIPIESLHTETGDGVYEASIAPAPIVEAADRAVLFKAAVKEIATEYQITPSFMAKPTAELAGCGGHIHQSLWRDGQNLFAHAADRDQPPTILRQYIAGQLHCLPRILPFYAPTVNSYKRFVDGSWAPTDCSWGRDNRTTALRAIGGASSRLETRVPGADANPYLSLAAALASGLYGIEHELELSTSAVKGSSYSEDTITPLPTSLAKATEAMAKSSVAEDLFGSAFVRHFVQTREWECRAYEQAVTDWERERYLEII